MARAAAAGPGDVLKFLPELDRECEELCERLEISGLISFREAEGSNLGTGMGSTGTGIIVVVPEESFWSSWESCAPISGGGTRDPGGDKMCGWGSCWAIWARIGSSGGCTSELDWLWKSIKRAAASLSSVEGCLVSLLLVLDPDIFWNCKIWYRGSLGTVSMGTDCSYVQFNDINSLSSSTDIYNQAIDSPFTDPIIHLISGTKNTPILLTSWDTRSCIKNQSMPFFFYGRKTSWRNNCKPVGSL